MGIIGGEMLKLSATFTNTQVLSLRTGGPVGKVVGPIINPNNLKIEGWYVQDRFNGEKLVLMPQDIREIMPKGFAVNDYDVLAQPEELVRLKEVMSYEFELIDKYVTTDHNKKLGKVTDYAVEVDSMFIKKLYVGQSLIKNFKGGTLSIDRTQILEITNRRIVVEEPTEKADAKAAEPSPAA